jgi:NADH-quinone oxidoreductase subunit L
MFRLVYLAFHGERRHAHVSTSGGHAAPHEAPPSMAYVLIALAIGSVLAGFIGVPHALGGSNRVETFLHSSFVAPGIAHEAPAGEPAPAAAEPGTAVPHGDTSTELMLMALSIGIAAAGIGVAMYFWLRNRKAADAIAARFAGIYRLLLNKSYVDEIYDAAIVQPIKIISTAGLWKGLDAGAIDGAVNGVGLTVRGGSSILRRLQTGSIRAYAASLFLGAVLVLGYYLWR